MDFLIECEYCKQPSDIRKFTYGKYIICKSCSSSNKQNINGKSLEYCICNMINYEYNIKCNSKDFDLYKNKFEHLSTEEQDYFEKSARLTVQYIKTIFNNKNPSSTFLNPDSKGKEAIVADIVVHHEDSTYTSFSIKNNKLSAKHQRPASFIGRCNMQDKEYRQNIKLINDEFFSRFSSAKLFNKVHSNDIQNLYRDVNEEVVKNLQLLNKNQIQHLFNFLNSIDKDLYIIKNNKKNIEIYDCTKKSIPTRLVSSVNDKNRIILKFNNKYIFDMRLHTASSRITQTLSLKYDTVLTNITQIYNKVEIKK